MKTFKIYQQLQNKLLKMHDDKQVSQISQFINDNNLLKNEKRTVSTLQLIASIVYSHPSLLSYSVNLISSLPKLLNVSSKLKIIGIEDQEIKIRNKILSYLFYLSSQSNQIEFNDDDQIWLHPLNHTNMLKNELSKFYTEIYQIKKIKQEKYQSDLFFNSLKYEDKIIEIRNSLHSLNPIVQAIRFDDLDLLKNLLLNSHFDYNNKLSSSIFEFHPLLKDANMIQYSAFFGSIKCFNFLQSYSSKFDFIKLLEYAIAGGNIEIIKEIKKKLENVNLSSHSNLLYTAILYMKNNLIYSIIHSFNIEIDAEAYIKCIYSSNYDAYLILRTLDLKNKINDFGLIGSSPIDIASFEGSFYFFKLLTTESNIHKLNLYGKNILQSASRSNKIDIVKYILKHHLIDPYDCGKFGHSSIEIAIYYDNDELYEIY